MTVSPIPEYVRDRDFSALGRGAYALKAVLERLGYYADEDGHSVFPKVQTIADALGLTPRAVQFRLRALEEQGFIALVEEAQQHRPRTYRIYVDRILALPLTETGARRFAREAAAANGAPGVQSFHPCERPQNARGEKYDSPGVKSTQSGVKSTTSHIEEESLEESEEESQTRARAGDPSSVAPRAFALTNRLWTARRGQIVQRLGEGAWNAFLDSLTPLEDDGEIYTLAAPSPFLAEHCKTVFGEDLEDILGRRVRVVFDVRAGVWWDDRKARREARAAEDAVRRRERVP